MLGIEPRSSAKSCHWPVELSSAPHLLVFTPQSVCLLAIPVSWGGGGNSKGEVLPVAEPQMSNSQSKSQSNLFPTFKKYGKLGWKDSTLGMVEAYT